MRFRELVFEGARNREEPFGTSVSCVALPISDSEHPPFFACGRTSGSISLYSVHSGNNGTFALKHGLVFPSAVNDICFSSDSLQLAAVFEDSSIRMFLVETMQEIGCVVPSKKIASTSCSFSPQNNLLVVGTGVGSILMFDVRNNLHLVRKLSPSAQAQCPVSSVAFHPDGSVFLTTATDGLVRVWDSTGPCLATWIGSTNRGLGSAVFSPNGRFALLSALEGDGMLGLWDLAHSGRLKRVRRYARQNSQYWMRCAFDARGNIICGDERGKLHCLRSDNGQELCSLQLQDIQIPLALATFQHYVACGGLGSAQPKLFVLEG